MSFKTVIVNVTAETPPPSGANFGTPALAGLPGSFGAGFTERLRLYPDVAAAQTDLDSGDINQTLYDALLAALGQPGRVNQIALLRLDSSGAPMQVTYTVGGGPAVGGEVSSITISGIEGSYTALAAETTADVAAGLRADLTTELAALPLTVSGAGDDVVITGDSTDDFFTYSSSAGAPFTLSLVVDESGLDISGSLADAISTPALDVWYGLTLESRADIHGLDTAAAIEALPKLFIHQSSSPGVVDQASTDDVAALVASQNRARTSVAFKRTDDQWFALTWMARKLAVDPDSATTTWADTTLSGITADDLQAGEIAALEAKNAAGYDSEKGIDFAFEGRTGDGQFLDVRITQDWFQDRAELAVVGLKTRVSNAGSKLPYNDIGINQVKAAISGVADVGINAGHFNQYRIETPLLVDVPLTDRQNRLARYKVTAEITGAIHRVVVNAQLVFQLDEA